jgi:LAO/AO transport system kinase
MGGLSRSALDSARVLDASGCDVIVVESVGVGQDELEIAHVVHTTVVVMAPGGGDDVQAIKAGILEIADILAVNKADREGADATVSDLEGMLSLGASIATSVRGHVGAHGPAPRGGAGVARGEAWNVPVLKLEAHKGVGLPALLEACEAHRRFLSETDAGRARTALKLKTEFTRTLREVLLERNERALAAEIAHATERAGQGEDPYALAQELVAKLAKSLPGT